MHYYYGKMTKDNRKAKVVARKSLVKSKISAPFRTGSEIADLLGHVTMT